MVEIKVKKLSSSARLPERMHKGDSGFDIHASESLVLMHKDTVAVPTGISVEIPYGYEMQIRSRSGLAAKHGVFVLNSPGTIDSNYRGEVKVILHNIGEHPFEIKVGDRIAQAVIMPLPAVKFVEVATLSDTDRGSNGFGSTDIVNKVQNKYKKYRCSRCKDTGIIDNNGLDIACQSCSRR